jgi:molybdenum cofactor cytidylyltransferase
VPAVSAIVPAAGLSRRMGGPNKLLLPWKDTTVIGAVVRTLLACGLEVLVVTGRDAEEVAQAATPARTVFNPRFEDGLGTSIATGAGACKGDGGFLIALADMPNLRPHVVWDLLIRLSHASPDAIVAPVYKEDAGRLGHPILFGAKYQDALMALGGDAGARAILQTHQDKVLRVPVSGRLDDVDTPADLEG